MNLKINDIPINPCVRCGGGDILLYEYPETITAICSNCCNSISLYQAEEDEQSEPLTQDQILSLWNEANNPNLLESEYLVIYKSKGAERNEIVKARTILSAIGEFYTYYGYHEILSVIIKGE